MGWCQYPNDKPWFCWRLRVGFWETVVCSPNGKRLPLKIVDWFLLVGRCQTPSVGWLISLSRDQAAVWLTHGPNHLFVRSPSASCISPKYPYLFQSIPKACITISPHIVMLFLIILNHHFPQIIPKSSSPSKKRAMMYPPLRLGDIFQGLLDGCVEVGGWHVHPCAHQGPNQDLAQHSGKKGAYSKATKIGDLPKRYVIWPTKDSVSTKYQCVGVKTLFFAR